MNILKFSKCNRCVDEKCIYYHETNNTCQLKKCSGKGDGYVNFIDKLTCTSYKKPDIEFKVASEEACNLKPIKVTMYMDVKDYACDSIKSTFEHHVDYILDLESWKEIVNVYGVKVEEDINEK